MLRRISAVFLLAWSFLLFFSSGIVESQDGLQYLTIARQMYYHRTFAMPAAKYPLDNIHMNVTVGRDGVEFAPTGLGFSVAYLPAVFLEDVFNKLAGIEPTENFPLENDWPIMLFGSMTNAFFGALVIATLYLFMRTFNLSEKQALLLSFALFCSSNLFVYSKHAFAHMMFVSFMFLSFYFIRRYKLEQKVKYIAWAAVSYGIVMVSYNPTYLLLLPGLGIYYLSSLPWRGIKQWKVTSSQIMRDIFVAIICLLPFLMLYSWFNAARFGGATSTGYGAGGIATPPIPSAFVFFEGVWGLLFSPGKSIFLFTPTLLLLVLFWFKLKREYFPEIAAGIVIFGVYLLFIASLVGGPDFFPWHGEASFGPRYMLPILPFALLLVVFVYRELTVAQRMWIFWPLITVGILVQSVGTFIPYQVRFSGLDYQYVINGHRITYDVYANFLPRFSPLYSMSKWFARKLIALPKYYVNTPSVISIDGTHGILQTTRGDWKQIEPVSVFQFSPGAIDKIVEISVLNHSATESADLAPYPLKVVAFQNEQTLDEITIPSTETGMLTLPSKSVTHSSPVVLEHSFVGTSSAKPLYQTPFLIGIAIDGTPISLESYSYPYVSRVSQNLFGKNYYYWGAENTNRWALWNMRSINYVHTLDVWWLKPFHYWDLPKNFFLLLFIGNVSICMASSYYIIRTTDPTEPGVRSRKK